MEQLTSVCGSFEARVLAARLYDEGIDAELRGALDSPYGFTVGDMARVDVYVPTDQAEDAQLVLLANEVDAATELPEPRWRAPPDHLAVLDRARRVRRGRVLAPGSHAAASTCGRDRRGETR